jgi:hypothetical protein
MLKLIYLFTAWPFILIGHVMNFIVWEFFSDGHWKQWEVKSNPVIYWQDQTLEATRELRELEYKSRRQMEENESKFREELKRKEREIVISQRS